LTFDITIPHTGIVEIAVRPATREQHYYSEPNAIANPADPRPGQVEAQVVDREWYYRTRQREHGPISSQELKRLIDNGLVLPTTFIRRGTSGKWSHASELDGSFEQFGTATQPARATAMTESNPKSSQRQASVEQSIEGSTESGTSWSLIFIAGGSLVGVVALTVLLIFSILDSRTSNTAVNPSSDGADVATEHVVDAETKGRESQHGGRKVGPLSDKLLTTEEVVSRSEGSVAFIKGRLSSGTGFLAEPNFLVTNKHVVSEELITDLKVHFPSAPEADRGPFSVSLLYEDELLDLAFLKIETNLAPLPMAQTYQFRRGQEVIVIGNPGVKDDLVLQNAISKGVMSSEATIKGQSYYQLGISINSGNSGGPVFDLYGQVIGVVTLKASRREGLGFCIPISQLRQTIEKSRTLSAKDIEVAESMHRIRVVFSFTMVMGGEYKSGMGFLTKIMENALGRGRSVNEGMAAVQDKVHEKLAEYDQALLSALKSEVSRISRDQYLSESIRQKFVDLWTNYAELKSYVENPRGNYDSYKAKYLDLSDKHDRLTEALKLLLGVSTPE